MNVFRRTSSQFFAYFKCCRPNFFIFACLIPLALFNGFYAHKSLQISQNCGHTSSSTSSSSSSHFRIEPRVQTIVTNITVYLGDISNQYLKQVQCALAWTRVRVLFKHSAFAFDSGASATATSATGDDDERKRFLITPFGIDAVHFCALLNTGEEEWGCASSHDVTRELRGAVGHATIFIGQSPYSASFSCDMKIIYARLHQKRRTGVIKLRLKLAKIKNRNDFIGWI